MLCASGLKVREKFRAVLLATWSANNPGRNPSQDGFLVKKLNIPGKVRFVLWFTLSWLLLVYLSASDVALDLAMFACSALLLRVA